MDSSTKYSEIYQIKHLLIIIKPGKVMQTLPGRIQRIIWIQEMTKLLEHQINIKGVYQYHMLELKFVSFLGVMRAEFHAQCPSFHVKLRKGSSDISHLHRLYVAQLRGGKGRILIQ